MNTQIQTFQDLITSHEQTRAGFIAFALEKNRRSTPLIESAKSFKILASRVKTAEELTAITEIRPALLTAAGLSDKALNYFTDADRDQAIQELVEKFLKPAGKNFVDEAVYRYLLIKGDSLGGAMRNIVGVLAQQKLIRTLLSNFSVAGIQYQWLSADSQQWHDQPTNDFSIEENLKALCWKNVKGQSRVFAFNLKMPNVKNNIDLCLFNADSDTYGYGSIVSQHEKILMLGELKGGIDPAGADEHWKTGNSALNRIRDAFARKRRPILTSFVAAAIEKKMAGEIFKQLQKRTLSRAANLTIDTQLVGFCEWLSKL
jgi:type II restriction enzyme